MYSMVHGTVSMLSPCVAHAVAFWCAYIYIVDGEMPPTACRVKLDDAVGRISAELLCPYPPGVPVAFPGERFTSEALHLLSEAIRLGGTVSGAQDSTLETVGVIVTSS